MIRRRTVSGVALAAPWILRTGLARAAGRCRVGLSLPLTGVQASVAEELLAGYQLAFGVGKAAGIEVDAVVEDDHSKPERTAAVVRRFGLDSTFVATSGIVGTPHAQAAIPTARTAGLPIVGLRSGASELRDGGTLVYHLRASYEKELDRMMGMLSVATNRIAIVASDDSFGQPAVQFVLRTAAQHGLQVVKTVMAERNGSNIDASIAKATDPAVGANALLVLMITRPAIAGVRAARQNHFMAPIFTMSFTAGAELAKAGPAIYRGLGLVTAFPIPRSAHDETSDSFRHAALTARREDLVNSLIAAEGYWYGSTIVRAISKAGPQVTRHTLVQALETTPGVSIGGERIAFDQTRVGRRYLQVVYVDRTGTLRS
ncbi:MAG: ABC transporter substrate-binding protein [Rhodocyclales bacterium]|nr:ABC transporter substrate-binding protein [Rhodocyclales bacterium]